jgi:hypothetical protein
MATRIRTLNFLPEVFRTTTNRQFLQGSLDQIVDQPNTKKIQGYVGSKFGYGINAKDYYVTEPTKVRTEYQLEPGVVFTKENKDTANDFISYPGILDSLKNEGGLTTDNNRLFTSEFYSWDSFTNLDPLINFNQYYWIPEGLPAVIVGTETVFTTNDYTVTDLSNAYIISETGTSGSLNPTLVLLRGGTYTFAVSQSTSFWIQGEPGVTGYSITNPNLQTRDVYGVTNNGATQGVVTFNVPYKDAQNDYNVPGNNFVDLISTLPFEDVDGTLLSELGGIDGVTSLAGLTVMFYNTGVVDEYGYVSKYYDDTTYDQDGGVAYNPSVDYPGTDVFNNNYEGGYYSQVDANFYTVVYVGDPTDPVIKLIPASQIPISEKITARSGVQYGNRSFFKNTTGTIVLIPYLSAPLDTLYYQDGSNPNKVGVIKLIESNLTNQIYVDRDIIGKKQYTAGNGIVFTNGLKVEFQGDVIPSSYLSGQYYVQGVGTAIELVPVLDLISVESTSGSTYIPYDTTGYDVGAYDSGLYIPVVPDYITITRNSKDKNAWSRSNRWFHIDVINATAEYNNDPRISTTYATIENKAKRPIIEFYPNIRLFDSGTNGKSPVDYIDFRATDAFAEVAGQPQYYPDVIAYSNPTGTIAGVSGSVVQSISDTDAFLNLVTLGSGTTSSFNINDEIVFAASIGGLTAGNIYYIQSIYSSTQFTVSSEYNGDPIQVTTDASSTTATRWPRTTTITIPSSDVFGTLKIGEYIADSAGVLPNNSFITGISGTTTLTISVSWQTNAVVLAATDISFVCSEITTINNFGLFPGARIIFAADENISVRNKIYSVEFSTVIAGDTPVITLTVAPDGDIYENDMVVIYRGYNNTGKSYYYDGDNWIEAQQKTTVNQPPLFDIFDNDGISLGNKNVYVGSSFAGCKLFSYGIGNGLNDSILGFPIRYSSINNVGDISFDVSLNSDTFTYVKGLDSITENVNVGYVYTYPTRDVAVRQLGWQTAVSPSVQYQIFSFDYVVGDSLSFTCDIPAIDQTTTNWPIVQVYINNRHLLESEFTIDLFTSATTITLLEDPGIDTVVQVLLLSDQTSQNAYYEIPINLNNNPLNENLTTVNVGDIRGQYQSIFFNNSNMTGQIFGPNNYRDLGNLVPWGNRIIQNSASLVLPGVFLRKQNHSLTNALLFNNNQYITFKALLIQTVNSNSYNYGVTPADILDNALDQMTVNKTDTESFFWSDMLPNKSAFITNTYNFGNSLDVSIYPLNRIYDFTKANYYGVLVYLTRTTNGVTTVTQLINTQDYVVSSDSPSLTVTLDLLPGDQITVKEYNQTYGSFAPNTPTKLGLYPATIPNIFQDTDYQTPTYFIVGHDGSFSKLYGNYNPTTGQLDDYRDQAIFEFEKRVYNNLKLSNVIPIQAYEVLPGFFRNIDYTYQEFLEIYSESFLNWIGQNRIEYKEQFFNRNNPYTYNYRGAGNKINNEPIEQGYWRGIYEYFYDTYTPNLTPWQMLGYANQPSWWTSRYGAAPYTSNNLVLWNDLAEGIDWNNGNPVVLEKYKRPGLLQVIPVDSTGNLLSPFDAVVGNYNNNNFRKDWIVGDVAPAELAFRRSSSWPFTLMRILSLAKPAKFYNLAVDVDNYKYNLEFNQYLVNDRSHLVISDIEIYGSGTAKTSYINWIVDYEKQIGVDATEQITTLLDNLDVRLVYRLAGFSDKNLLKFYVEKGSPNSRNASLLIPDESYSVLLYDNQPYDKIIYSSIIIQLTSTGFKVYGNSQTSAYFTISDVKPSANYTDVSVENLSAKVYNDFYDTTSLVPYGTEFYSIEQIAQFIASYGNYLEKQGMKFEQNINGIEVTWQQIITEFLYWAQQGWEVGSIITVSPAAEILQIDKDSVVVQPLVLKQQNFVLNQNLIPINLTDLSIVREGTAFTVQPLNTGDSLSYGKFNISNIEHGIVFDNVTLFNDVIYNLITGLRQTRIYLDGTKTAEWNGTLDAQGFILNQDNIVEWDNTYKYTKGSIVKYKNKFWTALTIVQPKDKFDEKEWIVTDYNEIQKGLLPNSSTNSYESTLYYDVNKTNLESDANLLGFSLIGYRPRDYLALADLTDITQVNVYQNLIKNKGTLNAASAFKGANLPQGGIDYDIYENWAIKSSEFGGVTNNSFIELQLDETKLPNNPSTVSVVDSTSGYGTNQEIPIYKIYNYGKPVNNVNILKTLPSESPSILFPDAGYVNFSDVKLASYYYSTLPAAVNKYGTNIPLQELYVRDYIWLANYQSKWQIMTPKSLGSIIAVRNNLNGTATVTFAEAQTIRQYQIFAIVNFNASVDGYYIASAVINPYNVVINLALTPGITNITGLGVGFEFQSQRVDQPSDIANLPLVDSEFRKNKVWVDTNSDGSWAVYRKSINYNNTINLTKEDSGNFGQAVAYTPNLGYLISDSDLGEVYRYTYNTELQDYEVRQTLTQGANFGRVITYTDDIFLIAEAGNFSDAQLYVYQLEKTTLVDQLNLVQTITNNEITSLAISGDKNWIFIGDTTNDTVKVHRKSQITGDYVFQQTLVHPGGFPFTNKYGTSVTTDYYGTTLVVGSSNSEISGITDAGESFIYNRLVQNFEAQYTTTSIPPLPQIFTYASAPAVDTQTATDTSPSGWANYIKLSTFPAAVDGDPVIFNGTLLSSGAIKENTIYYVINRTGVYFQISATRGGSAITLATESGGSMECTFQIEPIYVSVNGTLLDDNEYATYDSKLYIYDALTAGDIVNVSISTFVKSQVLDTGSDSDIGELFGNSVTTTRHANEVLIGAPFKLDRQENKEGAVYRYTNGGANYGTITGTTQCNITAPRKILLNGYLVDIPVGNATVVANAINTSIVTNVQASSSNGYLIISLINQSIGLPNNKLILTSTETDTFSELGIDLYTLTQTVTCPHAETHSQFGYTVKFNEYNSFVASAPSGSRYAATTFDFTDDELDNDTVFDNNATSFVDSFINAGAVYMFDYLSNYNESLVNCGKFAYAQSTDNTDLDYGSQPMYGTALDFNANTVTIGTPNYLPGSVNGQVTVYQSLTSSQDWELFRVSGPVVDTSKIENVQIYSRQTNNTLVNLDYIDPLQGKLFGVVKENIDFISNTDPASYNNDVDTQKSLFWGADKVGQIWFNTSTTRFMNYHQDDFNYNKDWLGRVFPGSEVAVYSFIESNLLPSSYQGPGVPFNITSYSVEYVPNNQGSLTPVYYYWVRNTNIIFTKTGKTISDGIISQYLANPQASGISYFAALNPNIYALYNSLEYINAKDSILHLGYSTGASDDIQHDEYVLIQEKNPDSFLPGLPNTMPDNYPGSLYEKMLDSMAGVDLSGAVVPDPYLPLAVQSGVLSRPRQSFFNNRLGALQNYIGSANSVLKQFPIVELVSFTLLAKTDTFYDTSKYWYTIDWWAAGYSNSTKPAVSVSTYNFLDTLNVPEGTIARVEQNGAGLSETYILQNGIWNRIGLTNGTIQISDAIWNYTDYNIGFGGSFFDTDPFDAYPSEETRNIVRALNEQLPAPLDAFRNQGLILLFNYIQAESIESQNYLSWLTKTSLIDVAHTIRELLPLEVFKSDNQDFLAGYLNEVKPYHVVIKEFLFKYTGSETYEGDITDFDVPATYDMNLDQFIAPQLVYQNPSADNEFLPTDNIWQSNLYNQWINNYGISLVGEPNYLMTTTASYLALNTNTLAVENASGFPTNGVITIGTEKIAYASVDRAFNILSGLSRGYDGTEISTHITGAQIFIDLPPAILLNGGRNYTTVPRVTAYIDTSIYPEPRVPAVLEAVMSLGTVIGINVVNPGSGYAVTPVIVIDPALVVEFNNEAVNPSTNSVLVNNAALNTGDLVQYINVTGNAVGGLESGQYYYINVLETSPDITISLYTNYKDCVLDHDRVALNNLGSGTNEFLFGAIASPIVSSSPVRENNLTLRFDRTTYGSQVIDWTANRFYGSFFAGALNYRDDGASSSIQLYSTLPPISFILASAQGIAFEIDDVTNEETLTWSSQLRSVIDTGIIGTNQIKIYPSNWEQVKAEIDATYDPITAATKWAEQITFFNTTLGFYIGMPIKFAGAVGSSGLLNDETYYVKTINSDISFTVSDTISSGVPGTVVSLNPVTITSAGLLSYPGEVVNQAILTVNYPGIEQVTQTIQNNNSLFIPLRVTGQGGTQNFYTGLPLFFTGNAFGGVVANEIYYVTAIIDDEHFTLSTVQNPVTTTLYGTLDNTDPIHPNSVIVDSTVSLRINDPIIFNNLQISGSSVTSFGGIVPGQVYYIAGISGNSYLQLTNSINGLPISLTAVAPNYPDTSGKLIDQKDVLQLTDAIGSMTANINLPVSPGQINGQLFTLYQTSDVTTNLTGAASELVSFNIDATIGNGIDRILLNENKLADAYQLYNNMPFRVEESIDNLVTGTTYYILDFGQTEIEISSSSSSTNEFTCDDATILYPDMPIVFSNAPVGNVTLNVTYYVREVTSATTFTISSTIGGSEVILNTVSGTMYGKGEVWIQATTVSGNPLNIVTLNGSYTLATATLLTGTIIADSVVVVDDASLYSVNSPIKFTGVAFGGITSNLTYYVTSVDAVNNEIAISESLGGTPVVLFNSTPVSPYLVVINAPIVTNQYITSVAEFAISAVLGGYTAAVTDLGAGYAIDNIITIPGTTLGGTSPNNDCILTVNSVNSSGGITSVIRQGTPATLSNQYYLKVINENQLAVYSDALLTVPVSGVNFNYSGIISTAVTALASPNITVTSTTGFVVNDPVVFTGDVAGNIVAGTTYYILTLAPFTISETPGGTTFNTGTASGLNFTMAKAGDYTLLPEPFYFDQSIVKYNNKVYRCIISNNDSEFIFGKWELLESGNRILNAMDRVIGYYQPTDNMPGVDLTQLFEGVTYPNSTYYGNPFAPEDEYPLDTILKDQPFYPTDIDMVGVIWDGTRYIAPANSPEYSLNVISDPLVADSWDLDQLSTQVINPTSIYYNSDADVYIITTSNTTQPLLISQNGFDWTASGVFLAYDGAPYDMTNYDDSSATLPNIPLYGSYYKDGRFFAVGTSIITSIDGYAWNNTYTVPPQRTVELHAITYVDVPNFEGYMTVGKITDLTTLISYECILASANGLNYYNPVPSSLGTNGLLSIAFDGSLIVVVGENGQKYTTNNGSNWIPQTTAGNPNLNNIIYENSLFVVVGESGTIQTSIDGLTWTTITPVTSEDLYGITYNQDDGQWTIVGSNNIILQSNDATTWTATSIFNINQTFYDVQGDPFTAGYGPEELVPGVVYDNLTMFVNTRPGTNWPVTVYQHVGFDVVSREYTPVSVDQTVYSFKNLVEIPAQIRVYSVEVGTGISTPYTTSAYTVDWVNETITTLPYLLNPNFNLMIEVYQVGNGDQLDKSNTNEVPLRVNSTTGFNEIYLNCNYRAPIYSGSGVIRPGSESIEVYAVATDAETDTILVENIKDFVANSPVRFSGNVFGGVQEDTVYYVKTISQAQSKITVSDQFNVIAGIAGPTFPLSDATGLMNVLIQLGNGSTWTDPIVYHNGTKLVNGNLLTVTRTKSSNNGVTCNTTSDLIAGEKVVFSDTMFEDSGIEIGKIYYIQSIIDGNEFRISDTIGGPALSLNDASGGASCIIADYAFGLQPNGYGAAMLLSGKEVAGYAVPFEQDVDVITYTVFGETLPTQYGYTIPETEYFTADGATLTFNMNNFNGGTNPTNAIVEVNGNRLADTYYTISDVADTITFTSAPYGTVGVTTFNDTQRQYFNTQYGITNKTVSSITSISNTLSLPLATTVASASNSGTAYITVSTTSGFVVGQTAQFYGTSFGTIATDGTVYFVKQIISLTQIILSTEEDLSTTFTPTTDTGSLSLQIGGQSAVRVVTSSANTFETNDLVRIDGVQGSTQLNNQLYYVHKISDTKFDLYEFFPEDPTNNYDPALGALNYPIIDINAYIGGGYAWLNGSFIITDATTIATDGGTNNITCTSTSSFVENTPIIFTSETLPIGVTLIGNIVAGTTYYIKNILDAHKFTISETQGGDEMIQTSSTVVSPAALVVGETYGIVDLGVTTDWNTIAGTIGQTYAIGDIITVAVVGSGDGKASNIFVNTTQWEQTNVDRIFVYVDGSRISSNYLRINPGNYLSILTPIAPAAEIIITSMMPSATPNSETFSINVDRFNEPSVYRIPPHSTTWLTEPLYDISSTIQVHDASTLVNIITQVETAPAAVDGVITIGIDADKRIITKITIYNETTATLLSSNDFTTNIVNVSPVVEITNNVTAGDTLTITTTEGAYVYISGEQIRFTSVDLITNTLSGLQRGVNGTGVIAYSAEYSPVLSILSNNRMPETDYYVTWNPLDQAVYNTTLGDPLQISDTSSANFLNQDES